MAAGTHRQGMSSPSKRRTDPWTVVVGAWHGVVVSARVALRDALGAVEAIEPRTTLISFVCALSATIAAEQDEVDGVLDGAR